MYPSIHSLRSPHLIYSRVLPQQVRNRIVRRLLLEILIPHARVAEPRERIRHPTDGVPKVPHGDAHAVLGVEARLRRVGVHGALESLRRRVVRELDPDVELGEGRLDAQLVEHLVCGFLLVVGGRSADGVVGLQTDTVDGDLALDEVLDCRGIVRGSFRLSINVRA